MAHEPGLDGGKQQVRNRQTHLHALGELRSCTYMCMLSGVFAHDHRRPGAMVGRTFCILTSRARSRTNQTQLTSPLIIRASCTRRLRCGPGRRSTALFRTRSRPGVSPLNVASQVGPRGKRGAALCGTRKRPQVLMHPPHVPLHGGPRDGPVRGAPAPVVAVGAHEPALATVASGDVRLEVRPLQAPKVALRARPVPPPVVHCIHVAVPVARGQEERFARDAPKVARPLRPRTTPARRGGRRRGRLGGGAGGRGGRGGRCGRHGRRLSTADDGSCRGLGRRPRRCPRRRSRLAAAASVSAATCAAAARLAAAVGFGGAARGRRRFSTGTLRGRSVLVAATDGDALHFGSAGLVVGLCRCSSLLLRGRGARIARQPLARSGSHGHERRAQGSRADGARPFGYRHRLRGCQRRRRRSRAGALIGAAANVRVRDGASHPRRCQANHRCLGRRQANHRCLRRRARRGLVRAVLHGWKPRSRPGDRGSTRKGRSRRIAACAQGAGCSAERSAVVVHKPPSRSIIATGRQRPSVPGCYSSRPRGTLANRP